MSSARAVMISFEGHRPTRVEGLSIMLRTFPCMSNTHVGLATMLKIFPRVAFLATYCLVGFWSCRSVASPACGFPVCRPSFAASPWPLPALRLSHYVVLPLSGPTASWSAQLTAISACKPSFAASCGFSSRKPSWPHFSSWPLF